MYTQLAILAAFVFVYSVASGRVERMPISGPIVFTLFGFAFGPLGFGLLDFHLDGEDLRTLAELTLAVVLFTDAARTNLRVLERSDQIPIRLLLIGLPLTILFGFLAGRVLLPGLTLIESAILATMLAPTDAALGAAVVTNPKVPAAIRVGLNLESGLNDGICVPVLFLFLAFAGGTDAGSNGLGLALRLVAQQIGIGLAVGLVLAGLGGWAVRLCLRRRWTGHPWRHVTVLALSFSCFALAQVLGGSGFIASFSGGLLFGGLMRTAKAELIDSAEGIGNILALVTWVMFGCVAVGQMVSRIDWRIIVYAILSLTVVRMAPVFLALTGSGMAVTGKLFMGWFGPRGLASIVFIVIVIQERLPGNETLVLVVACTVLSSILAHGFSAIPLIDAFAAGGGRRAVASHGTARRR